MPYGAATLERQAREVLDGAGDPDAGEWTDIGSAFHLRRRLTPAEAEQVGPVIDIRGTAEAARRARQLGRLLAYVPAEVLADELEGESDE